MKKWFLSVSLSNLLIILPVSAEIRACVQLQHNGATYHLTELLEIRKGVYTYRCLDSEYPLAIFKKEYLANKKLLRTLPDNRPFDKRHPIIAGELIVINAANLALNILGICKL